MGVNSMDYLNSSSGNLKKVAKDSAIKCSIDELQDSETCKSMVTLCSMNGVIF